MISRIEGTVEQFTESALFVGVNGLCYEVQIPPAVLKSLGPLDKGSNVSLVTYHYYQTDPSKSIPILIGFSTRIEKEFFEKFITVSGVGPKAAVRALVKPIAEIAVAIDGADLPFMKSLPGIGEQRAKEIIAKLQGKMGRFALIPTGNGLRVKVPASDAAEEAVEVLLQLQYKKEEAKGMVQKALSRRPEMKSVEDILNEVYRQKKESA